MEPRLEKPPEMERATAKPKSHPWSLHIATVAGIPIRIHFTFLLLLLFFAWLEHQQTGHVGREIAFVLGIFFCVLLHELGHALTALAFGIKTEDIVLYPIGGVARLNSMGTAFQEFWITAAGPTVNVVLAAGLYIGLTLAGAWTPLTELAPDLGELSILQRLWFANVILAIFNLIPAFPMDGGRLLRSSLSGLVGRARATRFAAIVGQAFAILFGVVGFFGGNPILVFIAIFIFLAAGQESSSAQMHSILSGHRVREAMIRDFDKLHHSDTLGAAVEALLRTSQQDFPVLDPMDRVIGVLTRKNLLTALGEEGRGAYVASVMEREFARVAPGDELEDALQKMVAGQGGPVLVFDGDRLVGMITNENLMEYLMVRRAMPSRDEASEASRV